MTEEERVCGWDECKIVFVPATHNQIYHTQECCNNATKARLRAKYYERKATRAGAKRVCKTTGCGTLLSRYNDSKHCAKCEVAEENNRTRTILEVLGL